MIHRSRFIADIVQGEFGQAAEGGIEGVVILPDSFEGPPGHVHGGVSAALLDEAMGMAVWYAGYPVVLVNLNTQYRRPVPLNTPIQVRGAVLRVEGRKVFATGALVLPDGETAVSAEGLFVQAPHLFPQDSAFMQRILGNRE